MFASTITHLIPRNVPLANVTNARRQKSEKQRGKQKLCQVLCVCVLKYDMCSDIRLRTYTTAVWIKKIGQRIADFHVWIIYRRRQENTRTARNRMQVTGFGRERAFGANCVWREAQRAALTLDVDGDRGLLAVGRRFVGGAAGDLLSALDVGRGDVERAHRAFSSSISQQRLCKTQQYLGRFDTSRSKMSWSQNFSCFLEYTSKTQSAPLGWTSLKEAWYKHTNNLQVSSITAYSYSLPERFTLPEQFCTESITKQYEFHCRDSVEVGHFIYQTQSISFTVILPAPLRCDTQAFVEKLFCLFRKDY